MRSSGPSRCPQLLEPFRRVLLLLVSLVSKLRWNFLTPGTLMQIPRHDPMCCCADAPQVCQQVKRGTSSSELPRLKIDLFYWHQKKSHQFVFSPSVFFRGPFISSSSGPDGSPQGSAPCSRAPRHSWLSYVQGLTGILRVQKRHLNFIRPGLDPPDGSKRNLRL